MDQVSNGCARQWRISGPSEPIFEILGDNFKVTLFPIRETKSGGVNGGVSGGVSELFDFIRANPGLKTIEQIPNVRLPQISLTGSTLFYRKCPVKNEQGTFFHTNPR